MMKIYAMGLEFFRKKLEVCRCVLLVISQYARMNYGVIMRYNKTWYIGRTIRSKTVRLFWSFCHRTIAIFQIVK